MIRSIVSFLAVASIVVLSVVLPVTTSNAQLSKALSSDTLGPTLSFQGFLTNLAGDPMDSTGVGITFKLYKGGTEIWMENRSVDVSNGVFNIALGQATTLDTIPVNQPIDLGIQLDGESSEMTPRTTLRGTAFSLAMRGVYSFWAEDINSNKSYNLVGGAYNNVVDDQVVGATIGGGGGVQGGVDAPHTISGDFGTIAGGARNSTGQYAATVGGGVTNNASGRGAVVGGGELNVAAGFKDVVSGGHGNTANGGSATVGGGDFNVATGVESTVAGGWADTAGTTLATVSGGGHNAVHGYAATVGGGWQNKALGDSSTVSGGAHNRVRFDASTVGGGTHNSTGNLYATVGGGYTNMATGYESTVAGGANNEAGFAATVGGGFDNVASGSWSTVPGGYHNVAEGARSFAAGSYARAQQEGTFVWQDATATEPTDSLATFAANQFRVRASGGFYFQTAAAPNLGTGARLNSGSGTWAALSSKTSKTAFEDINTREYLERVVSLDLKEWKYKTEDPSITHVGPMAEDFYAAFGHGPDEKSITTIDADGVALAAIQGLYKLVETQQVEIERMREAMRQAGIE